MSSLQAHLAGLKNVTLLGPQRAEDIAALLNKSKVLVNTSSSEGFPNTMLEAWSAGVPVVSLSVDPGGIIEREHLGLLSRTEPQLIRDVFTLANSELLNRRLGENGLAYVQQRHSLKAVCEAIAQIFPGVRIAPAVSEMRSGQC